MDERLNTYSEKKDKGKTDWSDRALEVDTKPHVLLKVKKYTGACCSHAKDGSGRAR